ncbi:uncharacterized protein LOC124394330 [Silurus meridionalis]|uniref:uncharacterized protein LOC124394330 n=1 Tax=Silurus meridionalis TaxID=175797 RepID=UPI001EEC544B|nr:uncharacterized protein LOC124394330 [Silurus meridionalis]
MEFKCLLIEQSGDPDKSSENRVVELRFPNHGSIGEGSFKRKSKSSPYGDNDDNNYETMPMIHQQMYGPGCSYYNFAYCKPPRDDLEDKTPVVQPPAKTTRIDSLYVEPLVMMSERSGGTSETVTNQPKSSVRTVHHKHKCKSPRHGDNDDNNDESMAMICQQMYGPGGPYYNYANRKPSRDNLEDKTPVKKLPAKPSKVNSSHVEAPAVSEHSGDTFESKLFTSQTKSRDGDSDDNYETMAMICQQMYGPGGPYYNFANCKPPRDNLKDKTPVIQPPAMMSERSGGTSETVTNQPKSSVRTEHHKHKCKSPRHVDNDDNNYESMAMIRQQMYGPGGPYYNSPNRKPAQDDLEEQDVTPVVQPPAKTTRIDLSYVEPPALMSECSVGTSETFTNKPMFSVITEHLKHKCKSLRNGDNDDKYENMAMICQQMYGPGGPYYNFANRKPPRDDLEDKTPVVQPPAKTITIDSLYVEPPAMMSERSGGPSEAVTNKPKSSVTKGSCKRQRKSFRDGQTVTKPLLDDFGDKTPVKKLPAKPSKVDSSHVEAPAVPEHSGDTFESKLFTSQAKSRDGDNDDNYETMAMICQQMYGPGGPYYNFANCKPPRDDLEDKTPVVQPPAKTITIDSLYVEPPAMMSKRSGGPSEAVINKRKSSVTKGSRKRQRKSSRDGETVTKPLRDNLEDKTPVKKLPAKPSKVDSSHVEAPAVSEHSGDTFESKLFTSQAKSRDGDSDDNYETMAMICQQMYGPEGPYYNFANRKPLRDNLKDKTPLIQPPALMSECSVGTSETFTNKPMFSVITEHLKHKCKSLRDGENDDKYENMAMICQQMYGPGGPYYNFANCKPPRDDLEDKTPVVQPPAKTITIDSLYVEPPAMMSKRSGGPSEAVINKRKSSVTKGSRKRQRKSSRDGETVTKPLRDNLEDKTPVKKLPAKPSKVDSSHVEAPAVSEHSGDTFESKLFTSQAKSRDGDSDDNYETMAMICQQMYGPEGPYYNFANRKPLRDNLKDKTPLIQPPALMSECSVGTSETFTNKPMFSVITEHLKHKCKSLRDGENDDKYENMAMICQQMYGPGGPYYNFANCKPPRDDLEDKTPVVQPPAKTITIDSLYVEPPAMMSERSGGPSEAVTNKPKSSVTKGSRKRQRKSSRDGETVTKPLRDNLEDKTPVKKLPAKPSKVDSSHVEAPAVSEHSGDTFESKLFTSQAKSSITDGSRKRRCKSPNDGKNTLKVLGMMIHKKLYGPGGRYHDLVKRKRPWGEDEDKKKDSSKPAKKFCSSKDRSDTQPRARGKGKTKKQMKSAEGDGGAETRSSQTAEPIDP